MAETPLVFEIATFAVLAVFFVVDLFIIGRKPHVPSTKECVQHIAFFVVMALIFGGLMWFFAGSKPAIEFYSGWLTEYSLSIDNLFVFVIIMSNFAVPKELQKFVLSVGITVALVTHEPDMATYASRRIIFKDGHLVDDGRGGGA